MDLRDDVYYGLNSTATFVWNLIDGLHSVETLIALYEEHYRLSPEVANRDVDNIIRDLDAKKLLFGAHNGI